MEITNWFNGGRAVRLSQRLMVVSLAVWLFLVIQPKSPLAQEAGGLPFFVDTATFKSLKEAEKSYVELYILLSSKSLRFEQKGQEYWAHLDLRASIQDTGGQEQWSKQWGKDILASSEESLNEGYSIFDIVGLYLDPQFYNLRVDLHDKVSGDSGFVTGELYAPAFPTDTLSISQLELSLAVSASEDEGDFVKNGLFVLPNPIRTYGPKAPVLYYYVEIYDLLLKPDLDSTYTIQQEILSFSGDVLKSYEPKTKKKPGMTSVEVGGISVMGLEPGTYFCRIRVRDNASEEEVFNQRWFRVSSPAVDQAAAPSADLVLTPERAEYYENLIKYIASDQDKKIYKSLELAGKARFLEDFWKDRDPSPSTEENEFQREHLRRWNYSNQQYSRFKLDDGWKTDRGRVYIVYGPPDDIERHPSDIQGVAWERWLYYSLEGGVEFIFGDLGGFDHYLLLHSTARGEYRDPTWPDKITGTH